MKICFTDGKMPKVNFKPYEQVQIKNSKKINFQTGKDSYNKPKFLLENGVEEVVGFAGDDSRLIFSECDTINVYGFLKTDKNNIPVIDSYCPFAVVRIFNDSPELYYLSMFGEFTSTPSKAGVLFYQYMNRQITLDDIPFEFIRGNALFRKALTEEEISRRIGNYLDEAKRLEQPFDEKNLCFEMDAVKKIFRSQDPVEFFENRLVSYANSNYTLEEYEQLKQEYLCKQEQLKINCFGKQELPINYIGEQE